MNKETLELVNHITQTITDKKGANVIAVDVRAFSTLTDYCIIAEGRVDKHVKAIAASVVDKLKEYDCKPAHVEGMQVGDWVVIDFIEIMVHIFIPQVRELYQLERLWSEGKLLELSLENAS